MSRRADLRELPIELDRCAGAPLHKALGDALPTAMLPGRLRPGARLPSSRELGEQLGVARGTVVAVFEQLASEGYLVARRGASTTVAEALPDRWFESAPGPSLPAPAPSGRVALPVSRWGKRLGPSPSKTPRAPTRARFAPTFRRSTNSRWSFGRASSRAVPARTKRSFSAQATCAATVPLGDRTVARRLGEAGIEALPLSRHAIRRKDENGLLLGFAPFSPARIRRSMAKLAAALTSIMLLVRPCRAEERAALSPSPRPTLPWILTQLVPSPSFWFGPSSLSEAEGVVDNGSVRFSFAWQVTPVLYSFGVNRRISPWRFFVVDPFARVAGSLELHVSPEVMPVASDPLFVRAGLRATFPLYQHGEYVALSIGTSYARFAGENGVIYEGGLSVLFGAIGLVASYSPKFPELRYGLRIQVRSF